jgi:hypothetical protein
MAASEHVPPLVQEEGEQPKKKTKEWLYEIGDLRVRQTKEADHYEIFHKDSIANDRDPVGVRVHLGSIAFHQVDKSSYDTIIPDEYLNSQEVMWLIECLKLGEELGSYSDFVAQSGVELVEQTPETNMKAQIKTFLEHERKARKGGKKHKRPARE